MKNVANSSPPLQHLFGRSYVALEKRRLDGPPQTRYTLLLNTASITKDLIFFRLNACNITGVGISPSQLQLGPVNPLEPVDEVCRPVFFQSEEGDGLHVVFLYNFNNKCGVEIEVMRIYVTCYSRIEN